MQKDYSYKMFTFSNTKESLSAALKNISNYIGEAITGQADSDSIILRSKWVLTELLTNVSKHTKDNLINFEILYKNGLLEIVRSEHGQPFPLSANGKINSFNDTRSANNRIVIQKDDLNILYAKVCDDESLTFEVEDVDIIDNSVHEIIEHFGLIIITKSSDRFTYKYDKRTETNVFRIIFEL